MLTLLGLGFLLGMRHALEADHAAAVVSLALRSKSTTQTVKQGLAWGIGHTMTLFLFSSVVLLLETVIPHQVAQGLECAVGFMLVGLGVDVIRQVRKEQLHIHLHQHEGQAPHIHVHSHKGDPHSSVDSHQHAHGFPYRALLVGLMHGMAGSAALIVLTLHTVISPGQAVGYIFVFGVGSTMGMGLLSLAIALPLRHSAHSLPWIHQRLQASVGIGTTLLGLFVLFQNLEWLFG